MVVDTAGVVTAWNAKAEELFGWSTALAVGHPVGERVRAPSHGSVDRSAAILASVLDGGSWRGDLRVERPDGSVATIWASITPLRDDTGAVVGAVGAAEDVSRQRALEREAADLSEHLRLAIEAGGLGTWRWHADTGLVVWDEPLEAMFGLAPGGFDGSFDTWVSMLHPDDRDAVLAAVEEAVAARAGYRFDHRIVRPDGSVRWIEGRGRVTVDDGEVTGTIGCCADITDRKRAEADAEADAARREILAGFSDAAIASRSHHDYLDEVTRAAVPRLGDWCSIVFVPEPGSEPEVRVAHGDGAPVAEGPPPRDVGGVLESGTPEVDPHAISVPLVTKRGVIGALQLVVDASGRTYGPSDLALARAAAGRVAAALEDLWFSEQHRQISRALQEALLPPDLPTIPGVEVTARYWPAGAASEVGGDFYDVFRLSERRWALVIGDVCGTGPDAAAVTAIVRHTLRAAARHGQAHHDVLDWVNEAVRHSGRDRFCTAAYLTIDAGDDGLHLRSVAGGHPLPIVVRADGTTENLGRPGTLLGVYPAITTHEAATVLGPGDVLVLHTDGVTDLPEPHGIDDDELLVLVAGAATAPSAHAVAESIRDAIDDRLPISHRNDDIAVVVLRVA